MITFSIWLSVKCISVVLFSWFFCSHPLVSLGAWSSNARMRKYRGSGWCFSFQGFVFFRPLAIWTDHLGPVMHLRYLVVAFQTLLGWYISWLPCRAVVLKILVSGPLHIVKNGGSQRTSLFKCVVYIGNCQYLWVLKTKPKKFKNIHLININSIFKKKLFSKTFQRE